LHVSEKNCVTSQSEKLYTLMQAMIFAAGMGTRLRPLTDTMPKALVTVNGKPLIEHVIEKLRSAGFGSIVINVHHFAGQIIDYLKEHDFEVDIKISDESDKLLDTGGGLRKAAPLFRQDEQILIHNVDILSNADLDTLYNKGPLMTNWGTGGTMHAAATLLVSWRKTKRYLLFDEAMRLIGWTNIETGEVKSPFRWLREFGAEHPEEFKTLQDHHDNITVEHRLLGYGKARLQAYAFSGIHVISPKLIADRMSKYPDVFPIMDFYLDNCNTSLIKGFIQPEPKLELLDVGKPDTLKQANQHA